jgi:small neutral amino acid transporter SnatA (MarC family)
VSAITWASFRFSDALSRLLSINSVGALNRILGFFILAIDLVVTGGKNILVTLIC